MTEQSIRIDSGEVRLLINDDPTRVIRFNPGDVLFVEKFYGLMQGFEEVQKNFQARLDAIPVTDGDMSTTPQILAVIEEACDWLMSQIDNVFGEGTSQIVFAGVKSLDMIEQFFLAITPYVKSHRESKVNKYKSKK